MDVRVGDKLFMKKNHPCGGNEFTVLLIGMDFRIRCLGCGREVMLPRVKAEKNIKRIERTEKEKHILPHAALPVKNSFYTPTKICSKNSKRLKKSLIL